jgi:hypothetical protein
MNRSLWWLGLGLLGAASAIMLSDSANLLPKCKAYVEIKPDQIDPRPC